MWIKEYLDNLEYELGELFGIYGELGYYAPDIDWVYSNSVSKRIKELIQLINFLEA